MSLYPHRPFNFDVSNIETPAYIVDKGALEDNLKILADVQERSGAKILLALKGFAMWSFAPLIMKYLPGITSSSTAEARLGAEEFMPHRQSGEVHACAPAYSEADFKELLTLSDHIVFNSANQVRRLMPLYDTFHAETGKHVSFGLRVNHEHREADVELYDPAAPKSRLGAIRSEVPDEVMQRLSGLHFHTLCELDSDSLERSLEAFEAKFGDLIPDLKWVNFGGGHHITRPGYDIERLIRLVKHFKETYGVEVYLEPGEAIAIRSGVLVTEVMDIVRNQVDIAILDTSATAHMPDVLEMPYRPDIIGAGLPHEAAHTYRLGGLTCLAGDVVGDYSFDAPLEIGQKLVFLDMAHYTMVKTSTFNGVRLPSIGIADPETGKVEIIKRFGYDDYKNRLS